MGSFMFTLFYIVFSLLLPINFISEGSSCYGEYSFDHNNATNAATELFFMTEDQYISRFSCEDLSLMLAGQGPLSTAQCMARLYYVYSLIMAAIHRRSNARAGCRPRYAFALCSALLLSGNVHPNPGPV